MRSRPTPPRKVKDETVNAARAAEYEAECERWDAEKVEHDAAMAAWRNKRECATCSHGVNARRRSRTGM